MKTDYYFQLTRSCVPYIKGNKLIKDSNVGGIRNTYGIFKEHYITIFKHDIILHKKLLGIQAFLRPYKKLWPKRIIRLPKIYWGKHPFFINMWLVLTKNCSTGTIKDNDILSYSDTTQSVTIKVLGIEFESKEIKKHLKLNKSFRINQKI